jgi:DNA modification methylase
MEKYIQGDIHEVIKTFEDKSFDFVYTNPPFGKTRYNWDTKLLWSTLFPEMFRVLKDNGNIAIHTSIPFTYDIIRIKIPQYHYVWKKKAPTNYLVAKFQPLRDIEEILIYYNEGGSHGKHLGKYFPQTVGDEVRKYRNETIPEAYLYNPNSKKSTRSKKNDHTGAYPTMYLGTFEHRFKPNDKTIDAEIIKKIIHSYTEEGDNILDMTCNSTFVGSLATEYGRNYVGIDTNDIKQHKPCRGTK